MAITRGHEARKQMMVSTGTYCRKTIQDSAVVLRSHRMMLPVLITAPTESWPFMCNFSKIAQGVPQQTALLWWKVEA